MTLTIDLSRNPAARRRDEPAFSCLTVPGATIVRSALREFGPRIGEVFKGQDGWKAYAGHTIPTEFCGTWDKKTEAVQAIHEADRLHREVG